MTHSDPDQRRISMHIHSFSLRFRLRHHPGFDVFGFIDTAGDEGFTGVNISANGPRNRDLGGTTRKHFARVRDHLVDRDMRCELDTSDTRLDNMTTMLEVAHAVGADRLRTYTKYAGELDDIVRWTIRDLQLVAPVAADRGITVVLENHEDFSGPVVARIVAEVDHPNIRALYDYGNSQMVGEDPVEALMAMRPFVTSVHLNDHVIVRDAEGTIVQGVAVGDGRLPIIEQTAMLYDGGQRRFCFENVWGYIAAIKTEVGSLPESPPFSSAHPHRRLDARDLEPAVAVDGEWDAFRRGWDWLSAELHAAGYVVDRE